MKTPTSEEPTFERFIFPKLQQYSLSPEYECWSICCDLFIIKATVQRGNCVLHHKLCVYCFMGSHQHSPLNDLFGMCWKLRWREPSAWYARCFLGSFSRCPRLYNKETEEKFIQSWCCLHFLGTVTSHADIIVTVPHLAHTNGLVNSFLPTTEKWNVFFFSSTNTGINKSQNTSTHTFAQPRTYTHMHINTV